MSRSIHGLYQYRRKRAMSHQAQGDPAKGGFYSANSLQLTCHPRDLEALRDFVNELELEPKPVGWAFNSSGDCCEWVGITCESSSSSLRFNIARITKLELVNRELSGSLSESLGLLDQLRVLNLSKNSILGSIPPSIYNLETLDLSSNGLIGQIPQSLNLPSLTNTPKEQLCRSNIPKDLFQLQRLNLLGIQENGLSGSLSPALGNLSHLVHLDVSSNRFFGEIPDVFDKILELEYFVAQSNRFTGGIPSSLSSSRTLIHLNLRNNSLSGPWGLDCAVMTNLTLLDLGSNQFNVSLLEHLPSCRNLRNVNLARNHLDGQVPESFKDFHSLSFLSLSNCSLVNISSALRILQHCQNLTTLILTLNFDNEMLPDDPNLHFKKLKVFVVADCRLTGSMPSWLSKSNNLELLDISWNRLTGAIPNWIGGFTKLFYLDLSNNSFAGEIPKSLTWLQSLSSRDISLDEPSLDFTFVYRVNENARHLPYNQFFMFPPTLELSQNNLSGPIWEEFGNLKKLHISYLNANRLSGSIPSSLSEMTSLEVLDLSNNRISGSIPESLQKLTFLSKFSVANNSLSGRIPSGGQFQTFPNSSFEGNHFCSDYWRQCQADTPDDKRPRSSENDGDSDIALDFTYGVPLGFGLSLLVVAFRQQLFSFLSSRHRGS
ncbi:unnamed protein product [Arabis nemorensis]|uniref:Leucine-rich repeat-containing N-terminal plant-type domain-containing protein n=1 Tax=Arabis nemorensis TaxID=586526 RepID=A0A565BDG1_9BRAS|nr:unnamed protein product [Arabis nemorensis]